MRRNPDAAAPGRRRAIAAIAALLLAMLSLAVAAEPAPAPADGGSPPAAEGAGSAGEKAAGERELERRKLVGEAESFIHNVDVGVERILPGNLGRIVQTSIFGIPLWRYFAVLCLFLLAAGLIVLVGRRFRKTMAAVAARSGGETWQRLLDVGFLALANPIKVIFLALLLRGVSGLAVTSIHPDVVWLSNLLLSLSIAVYFYDLAGLADRLYGDRLFQSGDRLLLTLRPILLKLTRVAILLVAGMQIYESITGQTMLSLIAGLGIGGLALALASQETLKNLIGFASIALDKAFLVGDSVTIAGFDGTVSHVGLRSLRLMTADGSSVVIPNATAINSNIVNKSRRHRIKMEISLGLSPATPFPKVEMALAAMRGVFAGIDGGSGFPPEVRLAAFEPGRLVLQAVLWFDSGYPGIQAEMDRASLDIGRKLAEIGVSLV
ncbi:MAG: mechanosensitive ion channel family protein [Planctomycetota bacterium]|jgi:MscS family membrane protein|nr:mechanosensitive ion channel family protein [Planctomycetota bacterium]